MPLLHRRRRLARLFRLPLACWQQFLPVLLGPHEMISDQPSHNNMHYSIIVALIVPRWSTDLCLLHTRVVQLARGLIAITGETGAGKSLISSAFSLAAGARVRGADLVGSKGSTAAVELQLELADAHRTSTTEVSLDRFLTRYCCTPLCMHDA